MHWLAMKLGEVVRADKLFDTFRKDILRGEKAPAVADLVAELCADARLMRSFDNFAQGTSEQLFFARMEALDTTTMFPIALLLFRSTELHVDRRRRALAALESWLVRRAILRLTAKNYNRTLTALLTAIRNELPTADEAVARELRASEADTAIWPSDRAVRERLEAGDLYSYINQARVRMLLEACELDVRDPARTEPIALPGGLSIEHALPQSWQANWPLPEEPRKTDDELIEVRNQHVHRLGNLTLVTQPLNSALSNAAWVATEPGQPSKREELAKRSVLLINQRLCQHSEWGERLIDQRGHEMTEGILRTWPGPDSNAWPQTAPSLPAEATAQQAPAPEEVSLPHDEAPPPGEPSSGAIAINDLPGIPDYEEACRVENSGDLFFISLSGKCYHQSFECTAVGGWEQIVGNPSWHVATMVQAKKLNKSWCTNCCE